MKIAFVTQPGHAVLPASGSVELWADTVARALSSKHEVTIYASRPPVTPGVPDGPVTYTLVPHGSPQLAIRAARAGWRLLGPSWPFFSAVLHPLEYWIRIGRDASRNGTEVIHVFNYSQALPVLRRLTDAKLVLHMHCEWLSQLRQRTIDARLRHADLIVGCSDYITDLIRDRFPHHAHRCVTIFNGVDVGALRSVKSRGAAPSGEIRLLNVGRVSPEKGLHVLVEALDRLGARLADVRLTVVGEESPIPFEFAVKLTEDPAVRELSRFYGRSYLEELRRQMTPAVAEKIAFVDRLPHEQVLRYYGDADVFVYPSLFESFAIPPVEAMGAGVAVVASAVGGMRETIVDGETGILVERDDPDALARALLRLMDDADLRRSLGAAGARRVAEHFSWGAVTETLEGAYATLPGPTDARGAQ